MLEDDETDRVTFGPDVSSRLSGKSVAGPGYLIQLESDAIVAGTSTGYGEPSSKTHDALLVS